MPRLIDVDALRHRLLCQPPRSISINFALELVSSMPTVDAEPVVRCKDCKYRDKVHTYRCNYLYDVILDDGEGFCSHGERREDAETN